MRGLSEMMDYMRKKISNPKKKKGEIGAQGGAEFLIREVSWAYSQVRKDSVERKIFGVTCRSTLPIIERFLQCGTSGAKTDKVPGKPEGAGNP